MSDEAYMARALFLAARGSGRTAPNPMVGAVVVSGDGVVVGQGAHERAGGAHAEVHALNAAGDRARAATLYCTLEPCCHVGRTGPCVDRIVEAGIARVVAAVEDPNPAVHGKGFAFLREHGVAVTIGVGAAAARDQNQAFFTRTRIGRPFVIAKAAVSADGYIAAAAGVRTKLTSPAADRHAQRVRAEVDAIAVGSGTVLADDPLLTPRGVYRERPLTRVVFDRRLRTPPSARLLSTLAAGPVIIMTSAESAAGDRRAALERAGASIEAIGGGWAAALARLGALEIGSLLIEGGAALHASAWDEDAVDFVRLYVAPRALGGAGVPLFGGRPVRTGALVERRVRPLGPDTLIEGYVHGPR
ncbi:MAG TPA: bifunctional diaminohydroxyphosphoribosylaminopyrimidine deaminase/5-amino-6-(5-phosphoribosylamino)uracil reductase RibD [Vicinamibacterales bacterium]|nr:bifunctional diaminohydroxyphosphoribosylaminopyrimidine deaminase/5-amino-6-(5-phosphoribosylamino)uracil reductase RibD [Vicinamibacterales bacterium]